MILYKSYLLTIITGLIYGGLYLLINWFSFNFQIQNQAFFQWELNIPIYEDFILVYFSAYLSFIPILKIYPFRAHLQIAKALIFSCFLGSIVFLVFPTECGYDRSLDNISRYTSLFNFLWSQDFPVTLMPSFHVTMSAIFILPIVTRASNNWIKFVLLIWLLMICISIILVHQHHIIDIFSGLALALLSLKVFFKGEYV